MKNKTNETWMRQIRHGWAKWDMSMQTRHGKWHKWDLENLDETWISKTRQIRHGQDMNETNKTWMRQTRHGWDKQDTDNHTNETWT